MSGKNKLSLTNFNSSGIQTDDQHEQSFNSKPVYGTYAYPSPRDNYNLNTINEKQESLKTVKKHNFMQTPAVISYRNNNNQK